MEKSEKVLLRVLIVFFGGCALLLLGWYAVQEYMHPNADRVLSRMERRDTKTAQKIIDTYGGELIAVAEATELIGPDAVYFHTVNTEGEEWLEELPRELADALNGLEEKFQECEVRLILRTGQIGVQLTRDGDGFSYLCYPKGILIAHSVLEDEEGTRCLDMGGGWELQMYYAPGS